MRNPLCHVAAAGPPSLPLVDCCRERHLRAPLQPVPSSDLPARPVAPCDGDECRPALLGYGIALSRAEAGCVLGHICMLQAELLQSSCNFLGHRGPWNISNLIHTGLPEPARQQLDTAENMDWSDKYSDTAQAAHIFPYMELVAVDQPLIRDRSHTSFAVAATSWQLLDSGPTCAGHAPGCQCRPRHPRHAPWPHPPRMTLR